MTRGGKRPGAGGKFKWNYGNTKVIRVPEAISDEILEIARFLDQGQKLVPVTLSNLMSYDDVTSSKSIDLTGVLIRSVSGQPAVFLSDLVRVGYQILPERLAQSASLRAALQKQNTLESTKKEVRRMIAEENPVYE